MIRRLKLLVAAAGLLPFSSAAVSQAQTAQDYAITHAKIFTLAGPPLEDGTVLIHDGKISAVGSGLTIPAGAQVIDAKGLQVYPGLFDAVTQMGLSEIGAVRSTVDTTETGSFNPDAVAATAISPSSAHIPVTRAAGITEVIAAPASGGFDSGGETSLLGGQASAIHLAGWTSEDMVINKHAAMVVDWPDIETRPFDLATFSRKEKAFADAKKDYDKQIVQLADYVEQARHYSQALQNPADARFRRDVKLEAMALVIRGEVPLLVFADNARQIRDAVDFCDKQKLKMILAGGAEAWKVKDILRSKSIPVILGPPRVLPRRRMITTIGF